MSHIWHFRDNVEAGPSKGRSKNTEAFVIGLHPSVPLSADHMHHNIRLPRHKELL
jgi:hypothetical protein